MNHIKQEKYRQICVQHGKAESSKMDAYNYITYKCKCCSTESVCCDKYGTRCVEKAKMSMSW